MVAVLSHCVLNSFTTYKGTTTYAMKQKALQFSSVQLLSRVLFFATPWAAAPQVPLPFTIYWNWLKLMSAESVVPSNHFIL